MSYDLYHGDVLEWAAAYEGEPFMALLCDPPYHLTEPRAGTSFISGSTDRQRTEDEKQARRGGFMGKSWDGGDIAFRPDTWAALARHLHPGAFVVAFASSRGWHRQATAMEDAGLIMHPSVFLLGWAQGSGFPKSTRIDTQIDKAAGAEGERTIATNASRKRVMDFGMTQGGGAFYDPATPLARAWAGHRYGLQALKPALEPILVCQVPYRGRPVDSITATGAGALWIDGARVPGMVDAGWNTTKGSGPKFTGQAYNNGRPYAESQDHFEPSSAGRWPPNLVLTHHPACNGACDPSCPVRALDEQAGERKSGARQGGDPYKLGRFEGQAGARGLKVGGTCEADSGPASRFFPRLDWSYEVAERLALADAVMYCAKASRRERDAGLEGLPEQAAWNGPDSRGGLAVSAARHPIRNPHPTVKPIALTKWLATLLLPPVEYAPRRLLVPFAGSGSEVAGALLAGWEHVTAVEREAEYIEIAWRRVDYWTGQPRQAQMELEAAP